MAAVSAGVQHTHCLRAGVSTVEPVSQVFRPFSQLAARHFQEVVGGLLRAPNFRDVVQYIDGSAKLPRRGFHEQHNSVRKRQSPFADGKPKLLAKLRHSLYFFAVACSEPDLPPEAFMFVRVLFGAISTQRT